MDRLALSAAGADASDGDTIERWSAVDRRACMRSFDVPLSKEVEIPSRGRSSRLILRQYFKCSMILCNTSSKGLPMVELLRGGISFSSARLQLPVSRTKKKLTSS